MHIAAADWSVHPRKRWVCECINNLVYPPRRVTDPAALLSADGPAVVGFDFPIGMPEIYCRAASFDTFFDALARDWRATNIPSLADPFYPQSPGGRSMAVLEQALGIERGQWLRRCDRQTGAGALFWTIGAKQVGRAAISGWREVLRTRPQGWKIWPFEEVDPHSDRWIAEIYPALGYPRNFGKRIPGHRRAFGDTLVARAESLSLRLHPDLEALVREGFGPTGDGEDPFDAFVGVLVMVKHLASAAPQDEPVRRWEGWILGAGADTRPQSPTNTRGLS